MVWRTNYARWDNSDQLDGQLKEQLTALQANETELEDGFYKNLEFGTGGMRGIVGPGTNRMNRYTIRKAAKGLAEYITEHGEIAMSRGVVIAYDSRHDSYEFALEAARTLGHQGIQTYVFDELCPTPVLSFAVRYLHAFAGIVMTASHNPPEYNGFKVYGPDGGQLTPEPANRVIAHVNNIENELTIATGNEAELKQSGLLTMIKEQVNRAYIDQLQTVVLNETTIQNRRDDLNIVFTPLHGTATKLVREGLKAVGFQKVTVVKEQEQPDPNFSTVTSPNPEEHAAFELAIAYGERLDADLLIATDPDADRVGIAAKNAHGHYTVLTGNETGALMLDYILSQKQQQNDIPGNAVMLKTIVTSELGRTIANAYQVETIDTLTGFKFIAEKIQQFTEDGSHTFLFGYEESYGYLINEFVRDKDAIQATVLAAEMAAYYKSQGKTLYEALLDLYEQYGYYREDLHSLTLKGKQGIAHMQMILKTFREHPPATIAGSEVVVIEDYEQSTRTYSEEQQTETINLPTENVLKYKLANDSWVCLRPSGTEPKIKFYFGVKGNSLKHSNEQLVQLKADILAQVERIG